MIQGFSFSWKGRNWNGYFNAIQNETVIAHFEDDQMRTLIGQSVAYLKTEQGLVSYPSLSDVEDVHNGLYEAIQKAVEVRLGRPLHLFLN